MNKNVIHNQKGIIALSAMIIISIILIGLLIVSKRAIVSQDISQSNIVNVSTSNAAEKSIKEAMHFIDSLYSFPKLINNIDNVRSEAKADSLFDESGYPRDYVVWDSDALHSYLHDGLYNGDVSCGAGCSPIPEDFNALNGGLIKYSAVNGGNTNGGTIATYIVIEYIGSANVADLSAEKGSMKNFRITSLAEKQSIDGDGTAYAYGDGRKVVQITYSRYFSDGP